MTNTMPGTAERFATPDRENSLVIGPSFQSGAFNSHAVDCPFVFSCNGHRGMTYVGWDGTGYQTALSWQKDGHWAPGQVVLPRDPEDPVRRYNAALTSIVRDNDLHSSGELRRFDGWYLATYHAYPGAGYETGPGVIGFVRSRNLVDWEPVGDLLRAEDGAEWERGGLYKSWLLEHDGLFYVFYNAKDHDDYGSVAVPPSWIEQTGIAVSSDLTNWRRLSRLPALPVGVAGDFDERFASDPCVLRDGDLWVMFYFGLASDGHGRESVATSTDLVSWTKSGDVLIDRGEPGSIDALHAHKPAIVTWDGRLQHFYTAVAHQEPVDIDGYQQRERRGIAVASGVSPVSGKIPRT